MGTLTERLLTGPAVPPPGICTAAFSGGADSTALLLCLHELKTQLSLDLRAVHVHHGIRGAEADRDAAFCKAFCERYGIPLRTVYADVPAYAAAHRLSEETAARKLRYEALEQAAPEGVIVTAHHAGDNAETVLFHLIRGSGLRGLCGIPPKNGRILRPMLYAEKSEILDFLRERGQDWVEDSTNSSAGSSRNRIRHELLPLLTRENPAALRHIAATASLLAEDDVLLNEQAAAIAAECAEQGGVRITAAHPAPLRKRVYMQMLAALPVHVDPSNGLLSAIDRLVTQGGGRLTVTRGIYAQVHRGILYLRSGQQPISGGHPLQIGENRLFEGKCCIAELTDAGTISRNLHKADTKSTLDFDKINGTPYFRQRRGTDRIRLPGRDFDSTLKKCVQAEVPAPERQSLYVLYDRLGCIYCEQVGIAARVRPDADSRRILTLRITRG